jgi:hypothetical protein
MMCRRRDWSRRFSRHLRSSFAIALLLVAAAAGQATAQDKAVIDRLNELDRQALADYAADDFESARLGLREAITLAGRSGLAADPLMAHLWADLGALYLNGFHDKPKGQKALSLALKIRPDARPSDSMMTPEVKEVLAALAPAPSATAAPAAGPAVPAVPGVAAVPGAPAAPVSPAPGAPAAAAAPPPPKPTPPRRKRGSGTEPDLPANIPTPLYCPSLDEAPPEEDVVMYCVLAPDIEPKRILLFYRAAGAEKWTSAPTKKSELGWIKAVLPAAAISGKSLQFYVEARDASDHAIANAGRDDSPNQLFIRDEAPSLSSGVWAGMQARRGGGDETGPVVDEDPLRALVDQRDRERAAEGIHRRRAGAVFFGLSVGSGYGWHPKEKLEFYEDGTIEAGYIPSGTFHLDPTLGYQVSDHFAVSLEARAQFIGQQGSGDQKAGAPATGAFLMLARAQYFIGDGNLQGTASLTAGVGDGFRLTIGPQLPTYRRNDSVRGGPFAVGGGLGVIYHVSRHFGLVVDVRGLAGFPNSAMVGDLTGGATVSF